MCKNACNIHILKFKPELQRDSFKAGLHLAWSSYSLQARIYCLPTDKKGEKKSWRSKQASSYTTCKIKLIRFFPGHTLFQPWVPQWLLEIQHGPASSAGYDWNLLCEMPEVLHIILQPLQWHLSQENTTTGEKENLHYITRRRLDAVTFNLWLQSYKPLLVQMESKITAKPKPNHWKNPLHTSEPLQTHYQGNNSLTAQWTFQNPNPPSEELSIQLLTKSLTNQEFYHLFFFFIILLSCPPGGK